MNSSIITLTVTIGKIKWHTLKKPLIYTYMTIHFFDKWLKQLDTLYLSKNFFFEVLQQNIFFVSGICCHLYLTFPGTVFRVFSDFRTSARCQGNRRRSCYGDSLQCICYLVRYLFSEWTHKKMLLAYVNDLLCYIRIYILVHSTTDTCTYLAI